MTLQGPFIPFHSCLVSLSSVNASGGVVPARPRSLSALASYALLTKESTTARGMSECFSGDVLSEATPALARKPRRPMVPSTWSNSRGGEAHNHTHTHPSIFTLIHTHTHQHYTRAHVQRHLVRRHAAPPNPNPDLNPNPNSNPNPNPQKVFFEANASDGLSGTQP